MRRMGFYQGMLAGAALATCAGVLATGAQVAGKPASKPVPAASSQPKLGVNADLGTWRPFPDDCYWNVPVDHFPVDPRSDIYIKSIGADLSLRPDFGGVYEGHNVGIPYVVVPGSQPRVPVKIEYYGESDNDYYPIPPNPPIEGYPNPPADGDRHLLIVDRDHERLFELIGVRKQGDRWYALSGAIFDLNQHPNRPLGWTSADAAGLPILPALVRYDEVHTLKEVRHAMRFTAQVTQRAFVFPATHFASRNKDENLPPMGIRVRLKKSYDISKFPPECQVILRGLKKYGMILADNGRPWLFQGAPDPRWSVETLAEMKRVKGSDFEVVALGGLNQ